MSGFFIGCDWGTTLLRLRLLSVDRLELVSEVVSDTGVGAIGAAGDPALRATRFRQTLRDHIEQLARNSSALENAPIVISGMASSSIGWQELPYAQTPWRLDGSSAVSRELEPLEWSGGRQRVLLLSGLRTETDVMRGEETQVLGLFQLDALRHLNDKCIVVLPGTHCKHVHVEAGRIVDFRTYMTGELFEVLGRHSILRHSVASEKAAALHDEQAFVEGVDLARELPLSAALFRVRTRQVLDGHEPAQNRSFMSGLLIGGELNELNRNAQVAQPIALCAEVSLAQAYLQVAMALGLGNRLLPVTEADLGRLASLGQACVSRRLGVI